MQGYIHNMSMQKFNIYFLLLISLFLITII